MHSGVHCKLGRYSQRNICFAGQQHATLRCPFCSRRRSRNSVCFLPFQIFLIAACLLRRSVVSTLKWASSPCAGRCKLSAGTEHSHVDDSRRVRAQISLYDSTTPANTPRACVLTAPCINPAAWLYFPPLPTGGLADCACSIMRHKYHRFAGTIRGKKYRRAKLFYASPRLAYQGKRFRSGSWRNRRIHNKSIPV